jgi:hypothetical protein
MIVSPRKESRSGDVGPVGAVGSNAAQERLPGGRGVVLEMVDQANMIED